MRMKVFLEYWPIISFVVGAVFAALWFAITQYRSVAAQAEQHAKNRKDIEDMRNSMRDCQALSLGRHRQTGDVLTRIHERLDTLHETVSDHNSKVAEKIGELAGTQRLMLDLLRASKEGL